MKKVEVKYYEGDQILTDTIEADEMDIERDILRLKTFGRTVAVYSSFIRAKESE